MYGRSFRKRLCFPLALAGLVCIGLPKAKTVRAADQPKLTAQEIVIKHLDSIGTAAVRSKIRTRQVVGTCKFTAKIAAGGTSTTNGPAVLASDGAKSLIAAAFNSTTYPKEALGYDGNNLTAAYIKPGLRSTLGDFLLAHKVTFKEGLITGSLSSAWPFWDLTTHDARLETGGIKKLKGRDAYVIKYSPKKGSDFDIRIYFDAETFQHVRTEYDQVISGMNGTSRADMSTRQRDIIPGADSSSRQRETRYGIVEEFSDYKDEQGLILPHTYRLEILLDGQQGTSVQEWLFSLNTFMFNEKLDPVAFNVETGTS